MCRPILCAVFLILIGLILAACDEEAVAPPVEESPAQLLEGAWTLRVSPDLHEPFLIPGTFSTLEDTVFFDTPQGAFRGDVAGRGVSGLDMSWENGDWTWQMTLSVDVAGDGGTLTGTFAAALKSSEIITGTVFGAPGDEIPEIAVHLTPSYITIPPEATLNFTSLVTGYHVRDVSWSLDPGDFGILNDSGRYTAPLQAPETTEVSVIATSEVDLGASDTATVRVEVQPVEPVCDIVRGSWEAHILVETSEGFCDDNYDLAYWHIIQIGCDLQLHDRGMVVDLVMNGRYATGTYPIPMAQYTYHLLFRDGVEIDEGSGVEYRSLIEPDEPYFRPIQGYRLK